MGGLVQDYTDGLLKIDEFITHRKTLDEVNDGLRTMASGDCIRCVVNMQ
jgi:S-(hydroxymethyl)glutathione dehydrogenase/alcohol dehydrogenase